MAPIFLHTPRRVEALTFLLTVVLMAYYLIQREYRRSLPEDASEPDRRTTTRTILGTFKKYALLLIHHRSGREVRPTRLTKKQHYFLKQLRLATPAQLLNRLTTGNLDSKFKN